MVIHVYHPYRQPEAQNHCLPLNGRCSHVCLPAPQLTANSAKTSCACPRGLRLDNDNLNCIHDRKLFFSFFYLSRFLLVSIFLFRFFCSASYRGMAALTTPTPKFSYNNPMHAKDFDEDYFEFNPKFSHTTVHPDYFETEEDDPTTTGFKSTLSKLKFFF